MKRIASSPPAVAVVNPIGCGDCLAAGIAWGTGSRPISDAIGADRHCGGVWRTPVQLLPGTTRSGRRSVPRGQISRPGDRVTVKGDNVILSFDQT